MDTLLLVDGNGVMHRAFHAIPPFRTSDGKPTNALYGFFSILLKEITGFNPNYAVICFDTPVPTFRKKLFNKYQVHRPKAADEFKIQIPLIRDAVDAAGITHVEKPGYEGDDVIGTIANRCKVKNIRVMILSGDKDILQLVDKNVFVISPQNGFSHNVIYDIDEVKKKFGIEPRQIPELKGLMGDPSDNYPGAKGIGPKTAASLINEFHTVDALFSHLDKVGNERIRKILETDKENVLLSKKLATIITDVDVDFDLEKAKFSWFNPALKDYMLKFEMHSLASRLFNNAKHPEKPSPQKPPKNSSDQMGLF